MNPSRRSLTCLLGAAVVTVLLAGPNPIDAATRCAERARLLSWLARVYEERPTAVGLTSSGELIELVRTEDGATWTLLVTSTAGRACILAVGEAWRRRDSSEREPAT